MIKYISLFDIMALEESAKLVRDGNEEEFMKFLFSIGFDTNKPVEHQQVFHRPITSKTNEPVFGMRFVGTERNDPDWKPSMEARMEEYRNHDPELYKEMFQMSYHFNHTGALIQHMKNKGSELPYYDTISGEDQEHDEYQD